MKYSRQRQQIWDAVRYDGGHPTAEQVYARLKPDNPSLSLATVYRNLKQLTECGRLRRVVVPEGSDRFDGNREPHEHLLCVKCGRVTDVRLAFSPALEDQVRAQTGAPVYACQLVAWGLCPACGAGENGDGFRVPKITI